MKTSVENKIVIGFVVSVLALIGIGWFSYSTTAKLIATEDVFTHTYKVIATLESGRVILTDAETAQRGYLLTGDEKFLQDCTNAQAQVNGWVDKLRRYISDNPAQLQRLDKLQPLISRRLAVLNDRIKLRQEQGLQAVVSAVSTRAGKNLMDQIERVISEMHTEENKLASARQKDVAVGAVIAEIVIVCGSTFACAAGLVAILFIRRDLKLRTQTQWELQESRAQLQSILDNAPSAVFIKDMDGRYLFINRRFEQIAGLSRDKINGRSAFELFSKEIARTAQDTHDAVLKAQDALQFEEITSYPDGPHTHLAVKFPLRDGAGKIYATAGISTDISERKRAQEELDRFFALSLDFLGIASADGYFKRVSPAVTDILGWSTEEFLSRPFIDFVHPDDHAATLHEVEKQIVSGQKVLRFENRYRHKDGSWRVLSWRSTPQPGGLMYATARDITERKAAEDELRRSRAVFENLFVSLPGLYLVLTPDLKIVAVSDAYLKATMTQREKIAGRGLFEIFPDNPDDPAATGTSNLRASLNRVLQNAEADTMAIQKYDVRRPDGVFEERFWSPINSPVFGDRRHIEYIIHRVEDVTDFIKQQQQKSGGDENGLRGQMQRMEAEIFRSSQEVQAANEKLHVANKELEAFSYSVSHDLRAPLRHVDGFVDLLRKQSAEKLDDRGRRYLNIIADSARRMGNLIDDLLVFSRMSRSDLHRAKVASESLVHEVRDALQGEINGRRVVWKMDSLPQIEADTAMIRQVWANLIGNAIKYSRTRDPAEIEIGCTDSGNGEFVFFVRDNGVGFDMQYVDKLFGVFQRLHRADEFEGTGIGLANVRRIVSRHGGRTWAEGKIDGGATFFFSLPKTPTEMKG